MALPLGTWLGPFEILAPLGAGGMGVVYRARDTRLNRPVAIKILPPEFFADPKRRERLAIEARAISSLSHPHICVLYDIGQQDGMDYLVMECLEGETLADRLSHAEGLVAATAMRYGVQISDALTHAHGRNILHRDLKTSNVMITTEDRVKVLDFGLAKRLEESEVEAVTRSGRSLTEPGAVVGTLHALAPELFRGQAADVRSDIWALGVVLYEMAAGHPPFQGKTRFELSAAVLREEPAHLGATVPGAFQSVVARCLMKEPASRYQSAAEVRAALETAQSGVAATQVPRRFPRKVVAYAGAAFVTVAAGLAALFLAHSQRPSPVVQYEQLTNFSDSVTSPALSPDGRILAFIHGESTFDGAGDIWAKLLPDGEPVQLTNDASLKMEPAFSPDGSKIAYTHIEQWNWDTWTVASLGGPAKPWLPNASGLTWIGPQQVLFSEIATGLYMKIVTADQNRGEERNVYLPPTAEISMAHRSYLSPDRKSVLVTEMDNRGWLPCRVTTFSGGSPGQIAGPAPSKCTGAAWSPTGNWMYFSADAGTGFHLWRQEFPNGTLEQITSGATEEEGIAVAPDGRSLITAIGTEQSSIYFQAPDGLRRITSQGYAYSPTISSDGKQVYYLLRTPSSRAFVSGEFLVADLAAAHSERLFPGFAVTRYDVSADGKRIVFAALDDGGKSAIWLASLTRSFPPRRLTQKEAYRPFFGSGGTIFYLSKEDTQDYVYRMNDDGTDQERIIPDPVIYLLAVSPDGQLLVTWVERKEGDSPNAVAIYPASGGKPVLLCTRCFATGPAYTGAGIVNWSPDEKFFFIRMDLPGMRSAGTFVIPLSPGHGLPNLPANGFASAEEVRAIPGTREIAERDVFPGRDPSTYAIQRTATQRNLYRVRLPEH
ncbi:MAG TPA: protein kinase [Candidatus Acidoferrum sp.]|jgi:serine/threonine protein kinase